MAAIQFSDQSFEISEDSGVTYKSLVCLQSTTADTNLPTTEEDTNCGTSIGLGVFKFAANIDAVCETDPTVSQVTYKDVVRLQAARTAVYFRYRNAASGSTTAGQVFYFTGQGYFTGGSLTGTTGQVVKFSCVFSAFGTIDITV